VGSESNKSVNDAETTIQLH